MSANQQLIEIDHISDENAPAVYVQNGLKPFLQMIKDEVCGEVPDLTTRKGRERIASLAATVSKRKAAVEKPGRDYLRSIKELPKIIEAELREFVRDADALRDEIRKPLTDWEAAETARKDKHVDGIQAMKDFLIFEGAPSAGQVGHIIAILDLVAINDSWEEFLAEAAQVKDETLAKLRALLVERTTYEAEQAELVRLRAEAEAQAQRDREAEIARAAAEQARIEAERRAQAERDAAARREQDLLDQAAAAQRATEQAARDAEALAERQRLQLQLQTEQAERQAAQAKADQLAAEQRVEQERIAAEQRQAEAVAKAQRDEIARQEAEAARVKLEAEAREADLEHKKKTNRAALEAFVAGGMTEECAKQAITLIAQRKIPAIAITY